MVDREYWEKKYKELNDLFPKIESEIDSGLTDCLAGTGIEFKLELKNYPPRINVISNYDGSSPIDSPLREKYYTKREEVILFLKNFAGNHGFVVEEGLLERRRGIYRLQGQKAKGYVEKKVVRKNDSFMLKFR